jgi:hypothetical protein
MTTPTPTVPKEPAHELKETLARWRTQQPPAHAARRSVAEFENVLIAAGNKICESLAHRLKDSTTSRVYFKELFIGKEFEELRTFFQQPRNWVYVDMLRLWLRIRFDTGIRVEGDPRYAGYYFEFVT